MTKYVCILVLLAQVESASIHTAARQQSKQTPCQSTELTKYDAEILLCLLPASMALRHKGRSVAWEEQTSSAMNRKDFYVFYVYDASASVNSSPTVGYFAINKHTAEVWNIGAVDFVQSDDLLAVQRRVAHAGVRISGCPTLGVGAWGSYPCICHRFELRVR